MGKLKKCWPGKAVPDFFTVWKRIEALMPRFELDGAFRPEPGETVRLAVDGTGINNGNNGEWIRVKWNARRGFFKMHMLVDLDTRRILEFCLTDMNGGDAAQLPTLMKGLLKECAAKGAPLPEPVADIVVGAASERKAAPLPDRNQTLLDRWLPGGDPEAPAEAEDDGHDCRCDAALARIRGALDERGVGLELRADGGYDARDVFSFLKFRNVIPPVAARVSSNTRAKGKDRSRSRAVPDRLGGVGDCTSQNLARMTKSERRANRKKWREAVRFGLRWLVEIVISAFERVLRESVRALLPRTAYVKVATKITACNYM